MLNNDDALDPTSRAPTITEARKTSFTGDFTILSVELDLAGLERVLNMPVTTRDMVSERLKMLYGYLGSWRAVGAFLGLPAGTVNRIVKDRNYLPKSKAALFRAGLRPQHWRDWPPDALALAIRYRAERW